MRRVSVCWMLALLVATVSPAGQSTNGYHYSEVFGSPDTGSRDGTAAAALFKSPSSVVRDTAGNIYVSDPGNLTVRKISPSGSVTTLAGAAGQSGTSDGTGTAARFVGPTGLAVDTSGNVYVADKAYIDTPSQLAIRRITPAGVVTTLGTRPLPGYLLEFVGIAVDDRDGSVVIANRPAHTVERMALDGTVTPIAGHDGAAGRVDGVGAAARFDRPGGVAVDSSGVIYVADTNNHAIRRIDTDGTVSTWAGALGDPGPGIVGLGGSSYEGLDGYRTAARLIYPAGLMFDRASGRFLVTSETMFVGRLGFFHGLTRLSVIEPNGVVMNVLRGETYSGSPALDDARAVTVIGSTVVGIEPGGALTRVAGSFGGCSPHFSIDGTRLETRFCGVESVAVDPAGPVYVADSNCTIRRIAPDGSAITLAGARLTPGWADGPGAAARFGAPGNVRCALGVAVGPDGQLYVADTGSSTIRIVKPDGTTSTLAGRAGEIGTTDGAGPDARFANPHDLAVDAEGNVYVANTGHSSIRKITPAGVVTTLAGVPGSAGFADGQGAAARFSSPQSIAVGPDGVVYVADTGNHVVRKITSDGTVTTIAGVAGSAGTVDGAGSVVRFNAPRDIAVDAVGNVFVGSAHAMIRRITPSGVVSTVSPPGYTGVTDVDRAGTMYLAFGRTIVVASTSDAAAAPPVITAHPASVTRAAAQSVTFTAAASSVLPVAYRWQTSGDAGVTWTDVVDGGPYAGASTTSLTVNPVVVSYPLRRFRVVAANPFGSVTSNAAVLTVPGMHVSPSSLRFRAAKNGGQCCANTGIQEVMVTFVGVAPANVGWQSTHPWLWAQPAVPGSNAAWKIFVADSYNQLRDATSASGTVTLSALSGSLEVQIPVSLTIEQDPSRTSAPIGQVDTPVQGASAVRGAIGISGWATDDLGVTGVRIYRNCLDAEPQVNCQVDVIPGRPAERVVHVGNAQLVPGARPDIDAAFPDYTSANSAGWGFLLLTNMLPRTTGTFAPYGGQGPVTLYIVATDREGHHTLLGRNWTNDATPTTITLDNDAIAKPFGAIDTPAQGERVQSVSYTSFGWVLTPDTNTVAGAGDIEMATASGLTLFVDGLPVQAVTYNQCRGTVGNPVPSGVFCNDDVANIFGTTTVQTPLTLRTANPTVFRNLDAGRGAIGSAVFDLSTLANGLHTIAWSATDSAGRVEGIGSRYFSVLRDQTVAASGPAPVVAARREESASDEGPIHTAEIAMSPVGVPGCATAVASECVVSGPSVTVTGRAQDLRAFAGHGIGAVHVWAIRRDVPGAAPVFLGTATVDDEGDYHMVADVERGMWDVTSYVWSVRTARFEDARTRRVVVR